MRACHLDTLTIIVQGYCVVNFQHIDRIHYNARPPVQYDQITHSNDELRIDWLSNWPIVYKRWAYELYIY